MESWNDEFKARKAVNDHLDLVPLPFTDPIFQYSNSIIPGASHILVPGMTLMIAVGCRNS
jgi:hypothetical protein